MPLPENKTSIKPFKSMDIKTALLAASNRKRKAHPPTVQANPPKQIKFEEKKMSAENNEDIEIIPDINATGAGDFKENEDLNVEHVLQSNGKMSPEKLPQEDQNKDDVEHLNHMICDNSAKGSSDELDSSVLNNSLNSTSALSENVEKPNESENNLNVSKDGDGPSSKNESKENQNDVRQRKKRKMTPEEAKIRADKREEQNKEKLQKKQELEAQKLQKQLEKEQRQKQKEEEKKEKERIRLEKKEREEKEKEEKNKMRLMMLEQKQEEKKKKEELRLKREEEKQKRDEEKLKRDEEKLKREEDMKKAEEEKQKAKLEKEQREKEKKERNKAAFLKFFVKGDTTPPPVIQTVENEGVFKPFQVSDDMTLAPVVPPAAQERFNRKHLDDYLQSPVQEVKELYIQLLKSGKHKDVRLRKRLRKQRLCDADVIIMDKGELALPFLTAKLLRFSENVRPPYWGTWRKHSKVIRPRNPFGQDEIFDYSVDSDDEWDEGGPGESLSGTENELESEDDYEVDNEFFVPHGYLSAEEEKEADEVENDPEKQKALLKIKQQEFDMERKKKTTELKPTILGCFIENVSELQDNGLRTFLQVYAADVISDTTIPTRFTVSKLLADSKPNSNSSSPSNTGNYVKRAKPVPEKAMPHLIRLLHGNTKGQDSLVKEFQIFWQQHCQSNSLGKDSPRKSSESTPSSISPDTKSSVQEPVSETTSIVPEYSLIPKRQLMMTIKKISSYGKSPTPALKKCCWAVHSEVLEKYGQQDAPIPNEWNYVSVKEEAEQPLPVVKVNSTSIKEFLIS